MRKHPLSLCLLLLLTLQGSAEKQIDYFEDYETQFYQTNPSTTQTIPSTDAPVQTPSQGQTPTPAPSPIPLNTPKTIPSILETQQTPSQILHHQIIIL